jgi:hypothetical protein
VSRFTSLLALDRSTLAAMRRQSDGVRQSRSSDRAFRASVVVSMRNQRAVVVEQLDALLHEARAY